jgi:NAD(P)-dependent dehydrogenase (short-subunit alcohol dehydrogenase family)
MTNTSDRLDQALRGKVAVVTGGNKGIGLAIARRFARAGAAVAISARTEESLRAAAAGLSELGADCLAIACDVRDPSSTDKMADTVLKRFNRVDTVVANAGVAGAIRPMHELSQEEWRDCIATNLDGVFLTFRRFIAPMKESGRGGSLIALSSAVGKRPLLDRTPYAAAKMGVIGLIRTLAAELGPHKIRANSICPGSVAGERLEAVLRHLSQSRGITLEDARKQFLDPTALKRAVEADEIAGACLFLASDASSAITGEDLNVSAGLVMY